MTKTTFSTSRRGILRGGAALAGLIAAPAVFTARARHLDALHRAAQALADAATVLAHEQLDLAAEALRLGHDALGEITGRTLPDDLLGRIFSTFCIGK